MKKNNLCKNITAILLIAVMILSLVSCTVKINTEARETESPEGPGPLTGIMVGSTPDGISLGSSANSSPNGKYPVIGGMEYARVTGHNQGEIKGDCMEGGDKKDTIVTYSFNDSLTVPYDAHTGLPTGQREHQAASFIHAVDRATPKFQMAACHGEQVEINVDKYRIRVDGEEEKYFTIRYENALIVGTELFDGENGTMYEKISFTFSKVTYTYIDGNIEFVDDWRA